MGGAKIKYVVMSVRLGKHDETRFMEHPWVVLVKVKAELSQSLFLGCLFPLHNFTARSLLFVSKTSFHKSCKLFNEFAISLQPFKKYYFITHVLYYIVQGNV